MVYNYLGKLTVISLAGSASFSCKAKGKDNCSVCLSAVPSKLVQECYLCAFNRDIANNKCLEKGQKPPEPQVCKTHYEKLSCFKEFSKEPFKYKINFTETNLDFEESPYFLMAFEKDNMDLALKQETEIPKIEITEVSVQNN